MKDISEGFKNLPAWLKLVIILLIIIIIYRMWVTIRAEIRGAKETIDQQQEIKVLEEAGVTLSFPKSQYPVMSNTLANSYGYFNDDEDMAYGVFRQLQNDLDVIELEKQFRATQSFTIADFLATIFNRTEVEQVNAIFSAQGISRRY